MLRTCTSSHTPWWLLVLLLVQVSRPQLLINVKNQGGDVLQETIAANVSDEWVSLEFQRSDGTLVTQLLDFRNQVQVMKALVLGEEERGQSQYQVMCFASHFGKEEGFIAPDAMAKLRQKNPGTVRTPEEDRGRQNATMDALLEPTLTGRISPHVPGLCAEARDSTYARLADLKTWATLTGTKGDFSETLKRLPSTVSTSPRCQHVSDTWRACTCHLELCIGWYPCGLKFCKGKDSAGKTLSYRCGIKTCRKCHLYEYPVRQKQLCLWDE